MFLIILLCSCTTGKGSKERELGKEYFRQADYKNSIKYFSEAIKKNPDYWKLYFYRGSAYQNLNKVDQAINDFSQVLKLISDKDTSADFYVIRGTLFHQKEDYKNAIADFDKAIELDPKNKGAHYYRAISKEAIGEYPEALKDYTQAINMASKFMSGVSDIKKIQAYLDRANVYRKLNKLDLALADDNRAIEIEETWEGFLSKGTTLAKLERFNQAILNFDKAVDLNPSSATAYLYRASSRLLFDCDLNKVLKDYYSVINIKSIDPETLQQTYNQIAWILGTAENNEIRNGVMAKSFALKSIMISKNYLNLDTLAVAYAECGEYKKAVSTAKESIALCELKNSELINEIKQHLHSFLINKPIREKCPGFETELKQLRKWQNGF